MRLKTITLIGSNEAAAATPVVEAALAQWPESERPTVNRYTIAHVLADESLLDRCGVAWVVLDQPQAIGWYAVLGILDDLHIPAMLTRPGETAALGAPFHDGVVTAPLEAPPASMCAILRTLWCQAGVVRSLRSEILALQTHRGGLCDQIGKIDEELRLAAQLQREFLPAHLPRRGNIEFNVFFRPAGYVSGDIYDVIDLDEHHVGFFVADAVGHGVPAALMTMYIKRSLQTKIVDPALPGGYRIISPGETLAHLNGDMLQQQAAGKMRFATACYGVIDRRNLEFSFARAGHPYPLLLHADGTSETLEPDGGMLGIFPDEVFEVKKITLRAGDRLLLYSDGFEVAFPKEGEKPGTRRIANNTYADEFKRLARGPLDRAVEQLIQKLDEQAGSLNQRDDLTVLCIGIQGQDDLDSSTATTGETADFAAA